MSKKVVYTNINVLQRVIRLVQSFICICINIRLWETINVRTTGALHTNTIYTNFKRYQILYTVSTCLIY